MFCSGSAVRIIFLRLFVSWWAIPIIWAVFPFMYLLIGFDEATDGLREITSAFWNGA